LKKCCICFYSWLLIGTSTSEIIIFVSAFAIIFSESHKENGIYVKRINEKEKLFESIVIFDHPRYIEQYKLKEKDKYISEYLSKLPEKLCRLPYVCVIQY